MDQNQWPAASELAVGKLLAVPGREVVDVGVAHGGILARGAQKMRMHPAALRR